MANTNFNTNNFSLNNFLPEAIRTKTSDALIQNLFDAHLTKDESKPFYGYVGKAQNNPDDKTPFVKHSSSERAINNLHPLIVGKVGTETYVYSFDDVLNKARNLGINTNLFYKWGASTSFNFVPPIDLDKFVNYRRYFWTGKVLENVTIPGNVNNDAEYIVIKKPRANDTIKLSVDYSTADTTLITAPNLLNQYLTATGLTHFKENDRIWFDDGSSLTGIYEIKNNLVVRSSDFINTANVSQGAIINILENGSSVLIDPITVSGNALVFEVYGVPVDSSTFTGSFATTYNNAASTIALNTPITSVWAKANYWVHEDDLPALGLTRAQCVHAIRPIIEFDSEIELSDTNLNGEDTRALQTKTYLNQNPLFNHYHFGGSRSPAIGTIFNYLEDALQSVDQFIQKRIAREANTNDFLFVQSLVEPETDSTLFYKTVTYEVSSGVTIKAEQLNSLWVSGPRTENPIIEIKKEFSGSTANVVINSIGEKESTDTILFTATSPISVNFESKVLGKYAGPIIRSNINAASRELTVFRTLSNGLTEKETINSSQLSTYITNGWMELMSDIYVGETVEIPQYLTFTVIDPVPGSITPADTYIHKAYTAEIPRYVTSINNVITDYYLGEDYDIANARVNNTELQGAWLCPKQLKQNVLHENREHFAFGDLTGHFRSIMGEQALIEGSLNGGNTYRKLENINFGLGGFIKNYNFEYNLFISHLLQDDSTPLTLIDFIESQYAQNILSVSEYLEKNLTSLFHQHNVDAITPSSEFIENVFNSYDTLLSNRYDLAIFEDSLMPISRWIMTLAAMKILPKTKPNLVFDETFGVNVIRHHDGHVSNIAPFNPDFNRALAFNEVLVNNSNQYGFYVDSLTPPVSKPWYKGMVWTNSTTYEVRTLNVVAVDEVAPTVPPTGEIGDFWLIAGDLYQFDGIMWNVYLGNAIDAWPIVDVPKIYENLMLNIENKIYNSIFDHQHLITPPATRSAEDYEEEYVRFSAKYNLNPYGTDYVQTSPWTWNYKQADFSAVDITLNGLSRWDDVYSAYLGTARPYLFPWKIVGLTNQPDIDAFITTHATRFQDASTYSLVPISVSDRITTVAAISLSNVANFLSAPSTLDGYNLLLGDKVLVAGQIDPLQNGIYQVQTTGATSVWVNLNSINISHANTNWIDVSSGSEYAKTTWFIETNTVAGTTFEQYRYWKMTMWDLLASTTGKKLCMNFATEEMLPPYVSPTLSESVNALLTVIPAGISGPYTFGDNGPIEKVWTRSVEYWTSVARVKFKNDPMQFLVNTWGDTYATSSFFNDQNKFRRTDVKKLSHNLINLHGEESVETVRQVSNYTPIQAIGLTATNQLTVSLYTIDYVIENSVRTTPIFSVYINGVLLNNVFVTTKLNELTDEYFLTAKFVDVDGDDISSMLAHGINETEFFIAEQGHGFNLHDTFSFTVTSLGIDKNTVTTVPSNTFLSNGLNQTYVHLMRYNGYDTSIGFNHAFLREWNPQYGYRFDSIVKTEEAEISAESFDIPANLRQFVLKTNPQISNHWLHALRITVVKIGKYAVKSSAILESTGTTAKVESVVAVGDASDWVFRIENYNAKDPMLNTFIYDTSESDPDDLGYETFTPLADPANKTWKRYNKVIGTQTIPLSYTVIGLQNLLNIIFGYIDRLESEGWRFSTGLQSNIDAEVNRPTSWQTDIEKFISYVYRGIQVGEGNILNPFATGVAFETSYGLLSEFESKKFVDYATSQVACDMLGNVIAVEKVRVNRNGNISDITSTIPVFSAHVFVDSYEHVVLFEDYIDPTNKFTLIFDPYLGLNVARLLMNGHQHSIKTGRPVLGGYYLKDNTMTKNMMAQTDDFARYYDTTEIFKLPDVAPSSMALIGFNEKEYFSKINIKPTSQLQFWQAMIKSKGTNLNIDAYLNNNKFRTAYLDEYWAYKVAEYGDARTLEKPELKISINDSENSFSTFQFLGLDGVVSTTDKNVITINQFDDTRWSYTNKYDQELYHYFMELRTDGNWTLNLFNIDSLTSDQREELSSLVNNHFYFSAERNLRIEDLKTTIEKNQLLVEVVNRDSLEPLDELKNQYILINVPNNSIYNTDLRQLVFYTTVGSDYKQLNTVNVRNDDDIIFKWTDSVWQQMIAIGLDVSQGSDQYVRINNLVNNVTIFDPRANSLVDIRYVDSTDLAVDNRNNFNFDTDTIVSVISNRLLRLIPSMGLTGNTEDLMNAFVFSDSSGNTFTRIELNMYGPNLAAYNGAKLINYQDETVVENIELWHPAKLENTGVSYIDCDFITNKDPAKYNTVPNEFRNSSFSKTTNWTSEHVGNVWWNTADLDYNPYYDVKIYPNLQDRMSRWGLLSDVGAVDVYEWVRSDVHPEKYNAVAEKEESDFSIDDSIRKTGRVANGQIYSRQRIWEVAPIAWSHVSSRASASFDVSSGMTYSRDTRMYISNTDFGDTWVTMDRGSYSDYGIVTGSMMVGWGNSGYNTDEENIPFGQLQFTEDEMYIIGQEITQQQFEDFAANPDNTALQNLFTSVKCKSSEMLKIENTITNVTLKEQFKNSRLVDSVAVTSINSAREVGALGEIRIVLSGYLWNAEYINYLATQQGYTITSAITTEKNGYSDSLTLALYEVNENGMELKEQISVSDLMLVSSDIPMTFDFIRTNIRVTMNINQTNFDPQKLGKVFTASLFADVFGGKSSIYNFEDLDPTISSDATFLKQFTDRVGEFYKFETYVPVTGAPTGEYDAGSIYVRKTISATVLAPFDSQLLSNYEDIIVTPDGSTSQPEQARGWRVFENPTAEDLLSDAAAPYNTWVPIFGNSTVLSVSEEQSTDGRVDKIWTTSDDIVKIGTEFIETALVDQYGTRYSLFTTGWGDWVENKPIVIKKDIININQKTVEFKLDGVTEPTFENTMILINGQLQPQKLYNISDNVITFSTQKEIPQGSTVGIKYFKVKPAASDFEFDPDIKDDLSKNTQFKYKYPYTEVLVRNNNGTVTGTEYYFWVVGKTTVAKSKTMSVQQITSRIKSKPSMFMTFHNILPQYSFTTADLEFNVDLNLPIRYQTATVNGLDTYVNRNDTFKIQFAKNYTLRQEHTGLDLKNKHEEWVLIRPGLTNRKVPKQLWDKIVDSACGFNAAGVSIPSPAKIDYDERHGTTTRYGFEKDQTLCDPEILVETIKYTIQNTQIVKNSSYNLQSPDYIDFLDFSNIDSYFDTPEKTRETMNLIWNDAKKNQVNEIAFACIEDIAQMNFEMTHLFKTSRLSVYSLRTINEVIGTDIVYDS